MYVLVEPATVTFYRVGEEKEFTVTLQTLPNAGRGYFFGTDRVEGWDTHCE